MGTHNLRIFEFQIEKPDLETIFLRATKKNWEENDLLGKKKSSGTERENRLNNDARLLGDLKDGVI